MKLFTPKNRWKLVAVTLIIAALALANCAPSAQGAVPESVPAANATVADIVCSPPVIIPRQTTKSIEVYRCVDFTMNIVCYITVTTSHTLQEFCLEVVEMKVNKLR